MGVAGKLHQRLWLAAALEENGPFCEMIQPGRAPGPFIRHRVTAGIDILSDDVLPLVSQSLAITYRHFVPGNRAVAADLSVRMGPRGRLASVGEPATRRATGTRTAATAAPCCIGFSAECADTGGRSIAAATTAYGTGTPAGESATPATHIEPALALNAESAV